MVWLDRRFRSRRGRLFAGYVLVYAIGRSWIEVLRVDHANHLLGLRLNDWTSAVLILGPVASLPISPSASCSATAAISKGSSACTWVRLWSAARTPRCTATAARCPA